ncbi:Calx-beta domain-containing protein [Prosthecobacter sp.]|uniref:Calx-beta domain-containing protein n=1 Tax=Prosthecobacter sp. TaxID=1965333 RepID=UPI003783D673
MRFKPTFGIAVAICAVVSLSLYFFRAADPGGKPLRKTVASQGKGTQQRTPPLVVEQAVVAGTVQQADAAAAPVTAAAVVADPVQGFADWSVAYLKADKAARVKMVKEGVELAQARRPVFKQLIKDDPRLALARAVPMVTRQQMPFEVLDLLEKRVNGIGVLRVLQGTPLEGEPLPSGSLTFREVELQNGPTYRAYVYGRRESIVTWTAGASLNGVAVDADFAVNEQPSRTLEVGEVPPADKPAVVDCPISGKQVFENADAVTDVITADTPAVETATETVYFCSAMHIDVKNQLMIMGEGVTGGAFGFTGILPAAPTPALGNVKVIVIPMTYADQNGVPSTEAALYATLRDVADHYSKSSYGRLSLAGVVTPPVKLKHNESWYVNRDTSNGGDISGTSVEMQEARDEARKLGFDWNDYDCTVLRHNGGPQSYGGLGGGSTVWVRGDTVGLWAHEIGHCFGLAHANFWDTAGTSSIGNGVNQEYGDSYDIMGNSGSYPAGQYNAQGKNQIRWLPGNFLQPVTQSGTYRIHAFDQGVLDPKRRYALNIVKDSQRVYWGEVRSLFDTTPWMKSGLVLGWRFPNGGGSNVQLIDTTNGSPFAKEDAAISLGSTFSDTESGIHITTVATNDSPRYMDVQVNMGSFPGNHEPTLTLAASASVVPLNGTVTFTATASDADGDTLAYGWQHFGSTSFKIVSPNSSVITRQFTSAGSYIVTCTVSDMKGGTCTRNQLITVGSSSTYTISGRVTLLGQGLSDVVITANGGNGVITDDDGYYTIPNLTANTYTLTPLLYGYSFGELFNNSITVSPSFTGADFEATAQSVVTISAPNATANELSPVTAGTFRLTRTGDTSQDLVVNVNTALGSATKTTDYTLSPDYVAGSNGFSTFTIPAGSETRDITLTPVIDALAEGPETATLQLGSGNGYLVSLPSTATVTIADDDTALPKVSITATANAALEGIGTPAVLTLSRTGPTTGDLIVAYTVGGTAVNGTDYTTLPGTVTIPGGSTTATVNIAPINDSVSEPLKTVSVTLTANAAYLVDPTAASASASVYDDDTQTVTVAATDATASEVDLTVAGAKADTGTFVVTRSGDTSAALTVYYAFAGTYNAGVMALHGVDYEAMPGSVVIPAGKTQASITIVPRFDTLGEGPEQVVLYLGANATNYILGDTGTATITITDNSPDLPYLDVVNMGSATEGGSTAIFRITARGGTGTGTLAVTYDLSGTASAGDFSVSGTGNTLTGTSITLNNGATVTKDVTITATNDVEQEDFETLTLTLTVGPTPTYQTYGMTNAATMWIKDNDYTNAVFVDTQVGTSGSSSFTEGASTTPVKFYVSRSGSTTAALTVNYTIGGTATSGSDYTALPGSIVIPAGALGVDLPVSIINDTIFEGTETITIDLAPGSYSRSSPGTVMYIADNDTATATVAFSTPGSSGLESVTSVNIPVTLTPAQSTPVTVEYAVNGTSQNTSSTSSVRGLPYWVRLVKSGSTITHFESNDGTIWTQRGSSFTVTGLGNTSYLAGIVAAAGSTTATSAVIDNYSITGLTAGATVGTETRSIVGTATGATHTLSSGVYTFSTPGVGISSSSTSDNFCYVNSTITNATDCTVTARVVSMGTTSSSARIGVMLRSTTAAGSVYAASLATPASTSLFYTLNRTTLNAVSNSPSTYSTPVLPQWYRMTRVGDVFTVSNSKDGVTWAISSGGTAQTISVSPTIMVGLGVSAATDGQVATGTFDSVSLNGSPVGAGGLQGRTIGFVNEQGSESYGSGVWTLNGSGTNLNDEGHFAATNVTGDFTFIARVTSLTGGDTTSQAGILMRQTRDSYSKTMVGRWIKSASIGQGQRVYSFTTAFGTGIDFTLPPGVLTFAPGETSKNIVLTVANDTVDEPDNQVTLLLSNANGAAVSGTSNYFSYTIVDDDSPPANPYVGFAAATSTVAESAGAVELAVSLASPATAASTVDYTVTGGTATGGGTDYTLADGTLSFDVGETVKTIPLSIVDDAVVDAAETIVITLANPASLQLGSTTQHTLTITDNDLPVVSITANDATASEAGLDPGQFTITRTGSTAAALTVNLTRSGTATSVTDYTAIATTQTIPIGASSVTVNVTPVADTTNEGTETVILTLASGSYTLGSPTTATVNLLDDDRSTVTLTASDPTASESGGTGQFTITRTAPTNVALTVSLVVAGTAANGTDYKTTGNVNVPTSISLASGVSSYTIPIIPVDDGNTEGDEQVTLSLNTGSYDIGTPSFGNVTIADNDSPPTLFINSPGSQGLLVANGNGVIVSATITDDGAPAAVTQQWSQISGPGIATIENPTAATTGVTFSAPGNYILRITATDTQFTVSDQVTVVVGSALVAADWITHDLGPSSARRGQSIDYGGQYTVTGTGAGYSTSSDQAHVMMRQISGDGSVVARLTSLSSTTALSGVSIRDSMLRACNRAVLGLVPGSGLQFRTRTTVSTTDALAASVAAPALPLWLKLERNATTGGITASYAADSAGTPGSWVQLGTTTTISMDAAAQYGLTTTNNSTAGSATGIFDHLTLTPAQTGPALVSEDATVTPAAAGSGSLSSGTYTIVGSTTGYFHGWQYYGDMVVTTRLVSFSSGAGSASGGIRVAESLENGAQLHLGRMPQGAYNGYYWTSLAGGAGGGVPSGISAGNWVRFTRKGNSITAYRAPDASGSPGTWIQIGQPQTVIMTTPVWVGFYVNNASGVGTNTCTFSNLTIAPLNKGPVVGFASMATWPITPVAVHGTVADDSYPTPITLTSLWSKVSGPGAVNFADATLPDTTATLAQPGSYVLRLTADDSSAQTYRDLAFTGYTKQFEVWQAQNWTGTGFADPNAAQDYDADRDGQANLLEYAFGTAPLATNSSPVVYDTATVSTDKYLRMTIPKNPAATDVTFTVEATSDIGNPLSWSSAGLVTEQNTSTQLIVRDSQPMTSSTQRYMRVKVVRN